ncbi:MAG TPA: phosphoribosyltransferase family protein [Acidimicrobiales bacterium]|nr:phosphoribosyltransferase family protein [Acidimicrobiales bacterium]
MPLDTASRRPLADLVRRTGYERREEPFQLSSGGWSHDYIDGKFAIATGAGLRLAAEAAIELFGDSFDAVGGPTMGADALAVGIALISGKRWFSVRKEAKGHGRGSWIEGTRMQAGDRVLMVEDVVSTGASLLRAAEKVTDLGAHVIGATALLDRSPAVAERFDASGIAWEPLLTWVDLGIEPL